MADRRPPSDQDRTAYRRAHLKELPGRCDVASQRAIDAEPPRSLLNVVAAVAAGALPLTETDMDTWLAAAQSWPTALPRLRRLVVARLLDAANLAAVARLFPRADTSGSECVVFAA